MDTAVIGKMIDLVVETGLFFAHADGKYSSEEKSFIDMFINQLSQVGSVDEIKDSIEDALNVTYSLETIVADTKEVVAGLNDNEKAAVLATMAGFIQNIIEADGKVSGPEVEAFAKWRASLA